MSQPIPAHRVQSREQRKCPRAILILSLFGLALIGLDAFDSHAPLLVWNASASAPIGLYRVRSGQVVHGDLALVQTPESVRQLAAERRYLAYNVPLIKRIAAMGGDVVCAAGAMISINGQHVADRLVRDSFERSLPHWDGCHLLNSDEVFLLMEDVRDSFDSRYFGPVQVTAIIGKLAPLWVN